MIQNAIYDILSNTAAITAIVQGRIYPVTFHQKKQWPGVVFQITDAKGYDAKGEPSQMDMYDVQIDVYSTKFDEVISISREVRNQLENYSGTVASVNISRIRWMRTNDGYSENPELFRITSKYQVTTKN